MTLSLAMTKVIDTQKLKGVAEVYRTRLAPTPSGHLHMGNGRSFWLTAQRTKEMHGELLLRIEDLDQARCNPESVQSLLDDFKWMNISWDGEVVYQSQRQALYLAAWQKLKKAGVIYPCDKSRKDIANATVAPHAEDNAETPFPTAWRNGPCASAAYEKPEGINWRFSVPDGRIVAFEDTRLGKQSFEAGKDFGDFFMWRRDNIPAYELAVVVDDAAQDITEVIRGEDLLLSTARQILLYEALGEKAPNFHHLSLVRDEHGERLAKRHDALSMKTLREAGKAFQDCLKGLYV